MKPELWRKIKEIFEELCDLPEEKWRPMLPLKCGGDKELQQEVERLLKINPGKFIEPEPARPSSPTEISLVPGEVLAGRYEIIRSLGSGGMADVYEAEDKALNKKRIALKVIRSDDKTLLERFKQEVELARQVRHRNVCAVYDIGHDHRGSRELIFLTMQLIPGETMAERLRRTGPLDASEWFPVAEQLCNALYEAHGNNVLHRDFKPGNVMLVGSGEGIRAIVTDFGIARAMRCETDSSRILTPSTGIVGTVHYMSPEQKNGEELAETSDIYSLGLVLYEMITGKQYWKFPELENVPEHEGNWKRSIQRCLESDPSKRFGSALELLDAIQAPIPDPQPDPIPVPTPPWWRRIIWLGLPKGATIAAFVVLAVTVTWGIRGIIRLISPSPSGTPGATIPLPPDTLLATIPFQADGDDNIFARSWLETVTQKLRPLQNPKGLFSVVPWAEVKNLTPDNAALAAATLGFNVYTVGTVKRQASKIVFSIQLRQVNPKLQLRSDDFSIPADNNSTVDYLLQHFAHLLGLPDPSPDDPPSRLPIALGFYDLGRGYLSQRDLPNIENAIVLFEKAIAEDPNSAHAYAYLAFAYALKYRKTHDPASQGKAMQACIRSTEINGKLALAHMALGMILQETGTTAEAIAAFEKAVSLDPTDREARSLLSMAYLEAGRMEEAKAILKEAIQRDPLDWFNYNDLGYVYYKNGELVDARLEFEKAVERAPDNPIANGSLEGICICFGKYDQAENIARKILAFKKSAMADANLAAIYEHQGHISAAVKLLQDAVGLKSTVDIYHLELGDAYMIQGTRSAATKTYRAALQLAQNDITTRQNDRDLAGRIALYNAKLGRRDLALSQLRQAQAQTSGTVPRPSGAEFLLISARIYELTGSRNQALHVLSSVVRDKCARTAVETIPDFASLRSDHRYLDILNHVSSL